MRVQEIWKELEQKSQGSGVRKVTWLYFNLKKLIKDKIGNLQEAAKKNAKATFFVYCQYIDSPLDMLGK